MCTGLKLVPSLSCSLGGRTSKEEVSLPRARAPFSSTSHLAPETVIPAKSGASTSELFAPTPLPSSHTPRPGAHEHNVERIYVNTLLVERLLKVIRGDPEASWQRVLSLACGHVDHGSRGDYGGNGVGAELQDPEIALDILRAVAVVGARGIPLVDVAEAVDLGGDVVAYEQSVARPSGVQRVIFLHECQLLISWMEEQALRGAEGHDLARAMPNELEAATIVGKPEVVDVAFLYLRECLEG